MANHLKPVRPTITIPANLMPLIMKRMEQEHYGSISSYFLSLAIYDIWCRRPHSLTGPLMSEPTWIREKAIEQIITEFLRDDRTGRAMEDGWFEKRIQQLVDEAKAKRDEGEKG